MRPQRLGSSTTASVFVLLCGGCASSGAVREWYGRDVVDTVARADRVEVFRVGGFGVPAEKGGVTAAGYPVTNGPVVRDSVFAGRAAKLLVDGRNYAGEIATACIFAPGIVMRFTAAGRSTDVLICFTCGQLTMVPTGAGPSLGRVTSFGSPRGPLLALARECFPADAALRE